MSRRTDSSFLAVSCVGLLGALALLATRRRAPRRAARSLIAAQRLNRAAGTIAAAVLADSAMEHYRGAFHNKAMVAPLLSAALSLAVSAHGHVDPRSASHRVRDLVYGGAILTGLIGTGFHLFNIGKRPGRFRWQNFFYGAPLAAPAALLLSGASGFLSERVRDTAPGDTPRVAGYPAGRVVAIATALGLLGTTAEVALLHFRGSFQNPVMYAPVTLPPLTALMIGHAGLERLHRRRRWTRAWLRITAALGFIGVGFHARGIARNMGGWRNWSQNLLNGPPLPAPPSFTGLALAGLAALGLMEDYPDG